jgi:hypothetical protein
MRPGLSSHAYRAAGAGSSRMLPSATELNLEAEMR